MQEIWLLVSGLRITPHVMAATYLAPLRSLPLSHGVADVVRLGLPIFLACCVEMVEALTIVLAIGVSRGWRSALLGSAAALATLAALIAVFGPALGQVPLRWLWLILGGLLTVFGLQWMRKAILRYVGLMAVHDEAVAYQKVLSRADGTPEANKLVDWYGFAVAFKGVLLEGIEVVFIVLAFGASQGSIGVGAAAAGVALVVIVALGLVVHRPLTRVPENTMKFIVGIALTTFGTFFSAAGAGVRWPHGEGAIIGILTFYLAVSLAFIAILKPIVAGQQLAKRGA